MIMQWYMIDISAPAPGVSKREEEQSGTQGAGADGMNKRAGIIRNYDPHHTLRRLL